MPNLIDICCSRFTREVSGPKNTARKVIRFCLGLQQWGVILLIFAAAGCQPHGTNGNIHRVSMDAAQSFIKTIPHDFDIEHIAVLPVLNDTDDSLSFALKEAIISFRPDLGWQVVVPARSEHFTLIMDHLRDSLENRHLYDETTLSALGAIINFRYALIAMVDEMTITNQRTTLVFRGEILDFEKGRILHAEKVTTIYRPPVGVTEIALFAILFVPYVLILVFVSRGNIIVQFPRGRSLFISAGILGYVAAVVIWIN
jgi:hypothetical protein